MTAFAWLTGAVWRHTIQVDLHEMRFLTETESAVWARGRSMLMPDGNRPGLAQPGLSHIHCPFPDPGYRLFALSRLVVSALNYGGACLLWVTQTGVWPSSENLHLYYRLRQSYGDLRLVEEAPGHLALKHETEDLATLLQLVMLFGWDAYVLPEQDYVAVHCSHDEWLDLYARERSTLGDIERGLNDMKVKYQ